MKLVLIIVCFLKLANSAPVMNMVPVPVISMGYPMFNSPYPQRPRIFWDIVGNWISGSEWFPIEVNVPDLVGNIVSGVSGIVGNGVQRIPVINKVTSPVQPRPFQYYMLVPMQMDRIPYSAYP